MDDAREALIGELRAHFPDGEIRADGIWLRVGMERLDPNMRAGWKLHVSSTPARVRAFLRAALPTLRALGFPFKVIRTEELLEELNEGRFGLTQTGKAVTIYPPAETDSAAAAAALRRVLTGFPGPAVPTDFAVYPDAPIYCRFGPYDGRFVIDVLGQKRRVLAHPELGDVVDPADGGEARLPEPTVLCGGDTVDHLAFLRDDYLFLRMVHLSAKGGVFLALPRRGNERRPVLVKTARAESNSDSLGRDAIWAIEREHAFLRQLAGMPGLPEPGELLRDTGRAAAIVRPWIEGTTFWELWTRPGAALPASRRILACVLAELSTRVAGFHERGVLVRDLSPGNILISETGVTVLDWEMAQLIEEEQPGYRRGTPGFFDVAKDRFERPALADDHRALLALAFMAESGVHPALLAGHIEEHPAAAISCSRAFYQAVQRAAGHAGASGAFRAAYDELIGETCGPMDVMGPQASWPAMESRFRLDIEQTLAKVLQPECDHEDVTVYSGLSGLLLVAIEYEPGCMLEHLPADRLVAACTRMLDAAAAVRHIPGLYFGEPGVALAVAGVGHFLGSRTLANRARDALAAFEVEAQRVPDMCHGVAGLALGATGAWTLSRADALRDVALHAGRRLVALAADSPDGTFWPWPEGPFGSLSGARLPGFAHGAAGVVYTLLSLYERFEEQAFLDAAEAGLETLARCARPLDGNDGCWWPFSPDDGTCWNAWCHGTPGIAKTLAKAVRILGRDKERTLLCRALAGVAAANNAGFCLCHGIASRLDAYADAREWLGPQLARAERDAALLSALDLYALESQAHGLEASGRSRGLMTGAAGAFRTLARIAGTMRGPFGTLLP